MRKFIRYRAALGVTSAVALWAGQALAQTPSSTSRSLLPLPQVHVPTRPAYPTNFSTRQTSHQPAYSNRTISPNTPTIAGPAKNNPWSGYFRQGSNPTVAPEPEIISDDYANAMESGWCDQCNSGGTCNGAGCGSFCGGHRSCWFGGVYGLGMKRDNENEAWFSFDTGDPTAHLLGSRDVDMDMEGGTELRFGRQFGQYGVEAVFWAIYSSTDEVNILGAGLGGLNTALDFGNLIADGDAGGLGAGAFVNDFYDGAARHRLRRSHEFQNVELNLIGMPLYGNGSSCGCRRGLHASGAVGVRYFRVDENFNYASDDADTSFGSDDDEMFYDVDVQNHLIGAQLGGRLDYIWGPCLSFYGDAKLGIYGNHISHHSRISNDNGNAVVGPAAVDNVGREFDIRSTKDDVAFLGELRIGANYKITERWSLTGGYRAVALTGVALATEQIPSVFIDIDGVADIDSNGSMILHGFLAGLECNY